MRELLSATAYMHENNIIHRDIKLENIMFHKKGKFDNIKLLDFGSACFHQKGSSKMHHEMTGNPMYASPEMLMGLGYNDRTDMWSIGVIFYKLLVNRFPYDGKTVMEITNKIQTTEPSMLTKKF